MKKPKTDRRREKRKPARAKVSFILQREGSLEIEGQLIDVSQRGFRAAHQDRTLSAGEEVGFREPQRQGRARVMWCRILPERVESGFLILESSTVHL